LLIFLTFLNSGWGSPRQHLGKRANVSASIHRRRLAATVTSASPRASEKTASALEVPGMQPANTAAIPGDHSRLLRWSQVEGSSFLERPEKNPNAGL